MNTLSTPICLTIDNNYVQHAAVTLTSLCINNLDLHFYIFKRKCLEIFIKKLENILK